jgi:hypothetical protein
MPPEFKNRDSEEAKIVEKTLIAALEDAELSFEHKSEASWIDLSFQGTKFVLDCIVLYSANYITVLVRYPFVIAEADSDKVLRAINQWSNTLPVGSFELLLPGRQVQFKTGVYVPPVPDASQFIDMLMICIEYADQHTQMLEAVLEGDEHVEGATP